MTHPLTDEIIMNLKQLNNLLQRFTNYRLVYRSNKVTTGNGDEYVPSLSVLTQWNTAPIHHRSYMTDPRLIPNIEPESGNAVHRRAYTSSTDPCQDGNYLIGKYG